MHKTHAGRMNIRGFDQSIDSVNQFSYFWQKQTLLQHQIKLP